MSKFKKTVEETSSFFKSPLVLGFLGLFVVVPTLVTLWGHYHTTNTRPVDFRAASVMITNRASTSGGTGIIFQSSEDETKILTNAHVCEVVKKGGLVHSMYTTYQALSYAVSQNSDLCIVTVAADLHYHTKVSQVEPNFYDDITVAGHPALMPNVLSYGHVSGRDILQVLMGFRKCTKEDMDDPNNMFFCAFLGGIPQIISRESVLVTATIMPGSSGSGVYNEDGELIGVVFAGSKDFGYAWIVPYEQVRRFLDVEYPTLTPTYIQQQVALGKGDEERKDVDMQDVLQKCMVTTDNNFREYCKIFQRDVLWRK